MTSFYGHGSGRLHHTLLLRQVEGVRATFTLYPSGWDPKKDGTLVIVDAGSTMDRTVIKPGLASHHCTRPLRNRKSRGGTMSGESYYLHSLALSNNDLNRADRPREFNLCDKKWDLLDEVFAPIYRPSTKASLEFLGLSTGGEFPWTSLLEIGSGTGIIAVLAALAGCERVVATDINPRAVENTTLNATRHNVTDKVEAMHSDLFDDLNTDERFDLIFWNSNFIRAPEDYTFNSMHERAFVDPGYTAHRRFLLEAPKKLNEGGSALLLFSSSKGDLPGLQQLADTTERHLQVLRRRTVGDGSDMPEAEYLLVRVSGEVTSEHHSAEFKTLL